MNKFRLSLLVILSSVLITSHSYAAMLPDITQAIDISFSNSWTLTGDITISTGLGPSDKYNFYGPGGSNSLFLNGEGLFATNGGAGIGGNNVIWWNPPNGPTYNASILLNLSDTPNQLVSDFTLVTGGNSYAGVGGTVSCVSGCVANTPLPGSLPMFTLALGVLFFLAITSLRRSNHTFQENS